LRGINFIIFNFFNFIIFEIIFNPLMFNFLKNYVWYFQKLGFIYKNLKIAKN